MQQREPASVRELETGDRFGDGPINQFLGVELLDPDHPSDGAWFIANAHLEGRNGTLHGGVVPLLLDGAAYLALTPHLAPGEDAISHDLHFSLLRTVHVGQRVELRGRVLKKGRNVAFLESTATVDGTVVATGRVTKSIIDRPDQPRAD